MEIKNGRAQDKTIINRIMQRFRPIAPKPVTEGLDMALVTAELVSNQKTKHKYVRLKKNSKSKIIKAQGKGDRVFDGAVYGFLSPSGVSGSKEKVSYAVWSFTPAEQPPIYLFPTTTATYSVRNTSDLALGTPSRKVVESWLVVDGMTTETCLELGELGSTDTEKIQNLELDSCPGLISDGEHKVQWMNHAYKKMVLDIDDDEEVVEGKVPVVVWLVLGEKINPPETWEVFTCTVRMMYRWRKEKHSQTMPCDVWKMDFGGFAWRLDATAALKLGR